MDSDTINKLLINEKWKYASKLIPPLLDDGSLVEEEKAKMAYNLIVCYIKMGDSHLSQSVLQEYKNLLPEADIKELQESIYNLPTKVKENELKSVAWFKSTTKLTDVIGLNPLKIEIQEKIIAPIMHTDLYYEYGAHLTDGFIFYGMPGTGKTLMAKAIAGETGIKMLIANIHELVSKFQGESAKNLHTIFEQARDGNPAIIFFDEIDSLAQDRNSSNISSTGGEDRRIINTLLTELDGISKMNTGIYVIGATNRPWDIDSAFIRSGRFNSFLYVPPPTTKERMHLFKYYISKLKASPKINHRKLAYLTFAMSSADIARICDNATKHTLSLIIQNKINSRPLKTSDFIHAIKEMPIAPLLKEYTRALTKIKAMDSAEREQYKDLIKDIRFYNQKGTQRQRLLKLASIFV